jgi:TolB-like protein/Flp pilus assembly protein TadD
VHGKGYRFQADVEPDLQRSAWLAVLPFENLVRDVEQDYVADGLTEETIIALGQIDPERLHVVGRTSSMVYKRTTKPLVEIGRELGVDYLVEGSVRSEHLRFRITSTLIRVQDHSRVWTATYDREWGTLLGLQTELGRAIAQQIHIRLSPTRATQISRRQTQNAEAYDLYLRGRYFWNQLTPNAMARAIDYYRQATAIDPAYALAWSGIADAHATRPITSDGRPSEALDPALEAAGRALDPSLEAAGRALAADDMLAEAHTSMALVHYWLDWQWPDAESGFHRAVKLDPTYAFAHRMLGHVLSQQGRHEEARRSLRRACELDPLYAMNHALSAQVAFQAGDLEAAVEHARQALALDPDFWIPHLQLAQAYQQLGRVELTFEALTHASRLSNNNSKVLSLRGYVLASRGRISEARDVLTTLHQIAHSRYVPPYAVALVHAALGDHDATMAWLEKALIDRDVHLVFLPVDPKWDPLRESPRFRELLRRCGFTRDA